MSTTDDLDLARRAAVAAGDLLLARYEGPVSGLEVKSSRTDMVSDADRDAEALVRELLAAERPDDGLLAEEGSHADATSGRRWVVDPLDGTTNYLYGFPSWAVSIALEDEEGGLIAVVHDALRDETFTAVRGEGAYLSGERRLTIEPSDSLDTALIATGFSYEPERRRQQAALIASLIGDVRDIRRAGAASLDLCWLAAGRVDAYFERGLQPWDWAAASLVVREAGGAVRELDGDPPGLLAARPGIEDRLETLVGRTA